MNDRSNGRERAGMFAFGLVFVLGAASSCGHERHEEDVARLEQAAVLPVTVSFQNGVAPSASYAGGDDATIRQQSPTSNFGTATSCEADGDDGGSDKFCLVRWNLTGIPAGSTVQSATITFRVIDGTSNTYTVYPLLKTWSESQVTWQNRATGSPWATAGALGSSDRGASVSTITGSTGFRTITLNSSGVAQVQSWVNGGTNGGVIVASLSSTDGIDFASNEHGTVDYHPRLTITYLPPDTGGTGGSGGTGGTGGSAGSGGTSGSGGTGGISTDPNLKVAFIADTSTGTGFRNVLNLVKNEGSSALFVHGDMSYSANPTSWWSDVETVLGDSFPVFIARGNHDTGSWTGYLPEAANHLGGATRVAGAHNAQYKTTFRGLVVATIAKGDSSSVINDFLGNDPHIWKICQWHENQRAMQVGGKTDEMGWSVYEACRQQGAIIQTGHEHSYSRTKTLTSTSSQIVDPSCSSAGSLCLGPGRTFVTVSGLGGHSVRDQLRCLPSTPPYGCNGEWASIYTNQQSGVIGAQFITFNTTAPNRASGYFKNINGATIDTFTITHD